MRKIIPLLLILSQIFSSLPTMGALSQADLAKVPTAVQLLRNAGFETGVGQWTASSGTLTAQSTALFAGNYAASWVVASSGATLSQDITPLSPLTGVNLEAGCWVNTVANNVKVCSRSGGTAGQCNLVPSTGTWNYVTSNSVAPSGGSIGVEVATTSASSATVLVDSCYVGKATNLSQVSQAQLWGTILMSGSSCSWNSTATGAYNDFATATCTYATTGNISAPSSQLPGFTLSGPPGNYLVHYSGYMGQGGGTGCGNSSLYRLYDGTNSSIEQPSFAGGGTQSSDGDGATWHMTYTTAVSNLQVRVQSYNNSASCGGASIYGTTGNPGVFQVYYYPSQQQTIITPPQSNAPTVTTITTSGCTPSANCSGSTYTPPVGVTLLHIQMVGAGGGGGGSGGATTATAGGAGANTTLGSSILVAGGTGGFADDAGGSNGVAGGSYTINSPAVGNGVNGGYSRGSYYIGAANVVSSGVTGGESPFFGGSGPGSWGAPGISPITNTGGGGASGGCGNGGTPCYSGTGGGSGAYIDAWINSPSSYNFSIGTGGGNGTAGANGYAGISGANGQIYITEFRGGAMNAPLISSTVTSANSGTTRTDYANVTPNSGSSCVINDNPGSWITGTIPIDTGNCTLTFATGEFSAPPKCFYSTVDGNGYNYFFSGKTVTATSTSVTFITHFFIGGSSTVDKSNVAADIMCIGPH